MKQVFLSILLLFCIFVWDTSFAQRVQNKRFEHLLKKILKHNVQEVSVSQIEKDSNLIYLDARAYCEFQVSHIKNAIWIGTDSISAADVQKLDTSKRYVVYCSIGYRSEKITSQLVNKGFSNVSNLYGGIFEWINQGNTVVDLNDQNTQMVHGFSKTWGIWVNKGKKTYKCTKT
jgi:rhodanese-related sulfurtransferase